MLPDELIVGDDCSTDNTVALVEDYAGHVPFPVLLKVNQKNLGSTKNFEETIKRCNGDLIFLSDQDDVWMREKVETIEAEFSKNPRAGLVFTDAALVDENLISLNDKLSSHTFPKRIQKKARADEFYKTLLQGNTVTGATAAFRARFVKDVLPIPDYIPNLIHDAWIALVISLLAEIVFLDKPLVKYRQHSAQQLGVNWEHENSVSMKERLKKAIAFAEDQNKVIENIAKTLTEFSALSCYEKVEQAINESHRETNEHITHLKNRWKALDTTRGRLPIILRELLSGRYHRFSRGVLSAAKDIFED